MLWSPGRILGLGSLGGEHAAPHAGNPGEPSAAPQPPTSRSPPLGCSPGRTPTPSRCELTRAGSQRRWARGSTAEPQPPPPRTCRSAAPPDTSGGPALGLAPSPPDLLSPGQGRLSARQAAPSSSAARGAVAAQPEPASSSPRDRRATPSGARAHRAPLLPGGSGFKRRESSASTAGSGYPVSTLDLEALRPEPRPAAPPGPLSCPPCLWPPQSPGKVCAVGSPAPSCSAIVPAPSPGRRPP